jgi:hypothetical protein
MYFNDLLKLSSQILACEMTKKYAPSMYLSGGLKYSEHEVELKEQYFRGAKRVNARVGEYIILGDAMLAILTGAKQEHKYLKTEDDQFVLHGKDEGCLVEGSWYDWLHFVAMSQPQRRLRKLP